MTGRTHKTDTKDFLPVSREDMLARGWDWYDILLVTGDAYVDHPSFGAAVIGRLLENAGYRVAVLAQPAWNDASAFAAMGRPELGVFIGAGNLDSMVAHYTAAKKRRSEDFYSPGRKAGCGPTAPAPCTPTARGRRSPASPSCSAGWRRRCAGSRITITGTIRSAGASFSTRARIFLSTAWARAQRSRPQTALRDGQAPARHPRHGGPCR